LSLRRNFFAEGSFLFLTDYVKYNILQKASLKIDLLKILIRLAKEVKALDNKKYIQLQQELQEIGKMIGGWIRSLH